jgi:ATP-dependent exoDNAse (exonuclease V) beta subunit
MVCFKVVELLAEGYRPCDIAILVRKNSDARRMAQALRSLEEPIASASDDASALSESLDCRFALALAELYLRPERNEPRTAVLEFLGSRGFIPEAADRFEFEKKYARLGNAWLGLCADFPDLGDVDRGLPADDFLEHCSRVFSLAKSGGVFFSTLLDRSRRLPGNRRDLDALVEWWKERSERIRVPMPEREDAVVISTIHKSKGLEYPVVIFAFADEKIDTSNRPVWIDLNDPRFMGLPGFWIPARSSLAAEASTDRVRGPIEEKMAQERLDQMNLIYVAMTRAVERLYVYSRNGTNQSNQTRSFFKYFVDREGAGLHYTLGEASAPLSRHKAKQPPVQLPAFSVAWRKKLRLGRIHIENEERETGKSVHEVLAGIQNLSDWQRLHPSEYPDPIGQHLQKAKQAVLEGDYRFFFECETAWNEREWLDSEGIIRPDRLLLDPEGVFHILDYKTGREQPDHLEQIQQYRVRIERSGHRVGRVDLLYI